MSASEMDSLIIRHLADIDAAAARIIRHIEPRLNTTINQCVEDWCKSKRIEWKWEGDFEKDDLWLAPADWHEKKTDEWYGWYELGAGEEGWETEYWLSQICGIGVGSVGVKWCISSTVKKAPWRKFAKNYVVSMRRRGLHFLEKEGSFIIPFQLDPLVVRKALEDDALEEALQPLRDALDKAELAKPAFDQLLAAAKQEFALG